MSYNYNWKNKEANFGLPLEKQVSGGTHVTFEIILKKESKYIALRRPNGIPEHELPPQAKDYPQGLLYFCHNLIRYGESMESCIKRIVKDQAKVQVIKLKVAYIYSEVQEKDNQWTINPCVIAEIVKIPQVNSDVTEVVLFDKNNIPEDFAWWTREELREFLEKFD